MRVLLLHNQPVLHPDHPEADAEVWVRTAADDIEEHLTAAGHRVSSQALSRNLAALTKHIAVSRPDVVFNLFEGHADRPASEIAVASRLEQLEIPFTGSPSSALRRALNKPAAKRCLRAARLPTPWSCAVRSLPLPPADFPWPVIVKPARRDASEGISQESVVTTPAALTRRVGEVLNAYGAPALIEEFLTGREFTIALIETPELEVLPITEVQFEQSAAAPWPILSYAAKWLPESPDYAATDMARGVTLSPPLLQSLVSLSKRAFRALHCRDYARVDLRLSESGEPMILEVNANPDLSPTACFTKALETAGLDRALFLDNLIHRAAARSRAAQPVHAAVR